MSGMFADDAAAASALAEANNSDVTPVAPVVEVPVQQVEAPVDATAPVDAGTNLSESTINIDINSVPEALRPQVQEAIDGYLRQADYTRKTQEVAPFRQMLEQSGMSAEDAQQALTFVQNLDDPVQLRKLYDHLQGQFDPAETDDALEGGTVDPRDTELKNLSGRLERFEQAQALTEATGMLNEAVTSVKTAHPDFTDADINRVQQLAVSHMQNGGSDITKAIAESAKDYAAWKNETLTAYIASKGAVTDGATPPLGQTTHAETPTTPFANLDEATKAALAVFGNSI